MSGFLLGAFLAGCGPSPGDIAANLSSNNPVTREDTAKIARNFGSPEVEAALLEVAHDDDAGPEDQAPLVIGDLGNFEHIAPMTFVLFALCEGFGAVAASRAEERRAARASIVAQRGAGVAAQGLGLRLAPSSPSLQTTPFSSFMNL